MISKIEYQMYTENVGTRLEARNIRKDGSDFLLPNFSYGDVFGGAKYILKVWRITYMHYCVC